MRPVAGTSQVQKDSERLHHIRSEKRIVVSAANSAAQIRMQINKSLNTVNGPSTPSKNSRRIRSSRSFPHKNDTCIYSTR